MQLRENNSEQLACNMKEFLTKLKLEAMEVLKKNFIGEPKMLETYQKKLKNELK